jgi:myosin-5
MAHIFDVGTRAWQPDAAEGWVASEVVEKLVNGDKVKLIFKLENGEVRGKSITLLCRDCIHRADNVLCRAKASKPPWPPSATATTPISRL